MDPINELIKYRKNHKANAGSIIMDCDYFNNGHRKLIEQAINYVPQLYCFVANDYETDISFEDRYKLIYEGTKDIKKVTLIPGNDIIVSAKHFISLYTKNSISNVSDSTYNYSELFNNENNDNDILRNEIINFALYIAPILNIKILFTGGEPISRATRIYNETIQAILNKYDIAFQIIPKTSLTDASHIEQMILSYIRERKLSSIKNLAPYETYKYIYKKIHINKSGYNFKYNEKEINYILSAISDWGGNIFQYFTQRGINELFIYGNSEITGRLILMSLVISNIKINGYIGYNKISKIISKPFPLIIKYIDIETINKNDLPILVTESIGPPVYQNIKAKFSNIYFLDDVCIHEYYMACCINPLMEITKNTNATLVLVNRAVIGKNPSKYESWLKVHFKKISFMDRFVNENIFKNAFAQYGYDREYMNNTYVPIKCDKIFLNKIDNNNKKQNDDKIDTGLVVVSNCKNKYMNSINGLRHTEGALSNATNNIYFLGNLIAFGIGADDRNTIQSHLQKMINNHSNKVKSFNVLNYSNSIKGDIFEIPRLLSRLSVQKGDIVICLLAYPNTVLKELHNKVAICKTQAYFTRPHNLGEVFVNGFYMNSNGYKQYAEAIYNTLVNEGIIKIFETGTFDENNEIFIRNENIEVVYNNDLTKVIDKKNTTINNIQDSMCDDVPIWQPKKLMTFENNEISILVELSTDENKLNNKLYSNKKIDQRIINIKNEVDAYDKAILRENDYVSRGKAVISAEDENTNLITVNEDDNNYDNMGKSVESGTDYVDINEDFNSNGKCTGEGFIGTRKECDGDAMKPSSIFGTVRKKTKLLLAKVSFSPTSSFIPFKPVLKDKKNNKS